MKQDLFHSIIEAPYIYKEVFYDSDKLPQNKSCIKCKERDCLGLYRSNTQFDEYICSKGFNSMLIYLNEAKFILNGLILDTNNSISKERKEARKEYYIKCNNLDLLNSRILKINEHFTKKINDNIEQHF